MDNGIQNIPEAGFEIGITTTGRKSGRPHRKQVRLYNVDGRFYITGSPGPRDWYANLPADMRFTVQLGGEIRTVLDASATPIGEVTRRVAVLSLIHQRRGRRLEDLAATLEGSPLVEVNFSR